MLTADRLTRVSWSCVHFSGGAAASPALRAALAAAGVAAFDLNGATVRSDGDLLRSLAQAMRFPGYFGMNWDAVDECLRGLPEQVPAKGYVLFVHESAWLWQRCRPAMGMLIEAWQGAAEEMAQDGIPLHLVLLEPPAPSAVA
jgi:Barstar (barnase inhibitor)